MIATQTAPRFGFDSPPKVRPVLPQSERDRGKLWSDVVFEAVLALRELLTSRSEAISSGAANTILDLERTRMRHDKCLAGSSSPSEAQLEFERESRLPPSRASYDDELDELATLAEAIPPPKPRPAKVEATPAPAPVEKPFSPGSRREEQELFQIHAAEAFAILVENRCPGDDGPPVTMEDAMVFVETQFETWNLKSSDVPSGKFWDLLHPAWMAGTPGNFDRRPRPAQ